MNAFAARPARPLRMLGMVLLCWVTMRGLAWAAWPAELASTRLPLPSSLVLDTSSSLPLGGPVTPIPASPFLGWFSAPVAKLNEAGRDRQAPWAKLPASFSSGSMATPRLATGAMVSPVVTPAERQWATTPGAGAKGETLSSAPMILPEPVPQAYALAHSTSERVWRPPIWRRGTGLRQPTALHSRPLGKRWSLSAWMLARSEGSGGPGGNDAALGRSQAGARLNYMLNHHGLAATLRASTALGGSAAVEIAPGLMWRFRGVGVIAERRQRLSIGGRNAFAFTAFAGVYREKLPAQLRLALDLQGGMVGMKRHDGFAEAQLRLTRPAFRLEDWEFAAGLAGAGAIQPRLRRVDTGPMVELRSPRHARGMRIEAGWRFRLAGNARPGSGPAIVIGFDR